MAACVSGIRTARYHTMSAPSTRLSVTLPLLGEGRTSQRLTTNAQKFALRSASPTHVRLVLFFRRSVHFTSMIRAYTITRLLPSRISCQANKRATICLSDSHIKTVRSFIFIGVRSPYTLLRQDDQRESTFRVSLNTKVLEQYVSMISTSDQPGFYNCLLSQRESYKIMTTPSRQHQPLLDCLSR